MQVIAATDGLSDIMFPLEILELSARALSQVSGPFDFDFDFDFD